mmetsp:Transcript_13306/g.30173  ORF Transcript_13306/g.30173 Transcript_13306/m.30173 type:complete len:220 (-) Transcript_13306:542-1201(-)
MYPPSSISFWSRATLLRCTTPCRARNCSNWSLAASDPGAATGAGTGGARGGRGARGGFATGSTSRIPGGGDLNKLFLRRFGGDADFFLLLLLLLDTLFALRLLDRRARGDGVRRRGERVRDRRRDRDRRRRERDRERDRRGRCDCWGASLRPPSSCSANRAPPTSRGKSTRSRSSMKSRFTWESRLALFTSEGGSRAGASLGSIGMYARPDSWRAFPAA